MKNIYRLVITVNLLFVACAAMAQSYPKDFYKKINDYDLSSLWKADKLYQPGDDSIKNDVDFPEPMGYIGYERQRFYIHYLTIWKDKTNPYLYHVTGKTRIKNDILNFTGTIKIEKATYDPFLYFDKYILGQAICQVELHQDSAKHTAGLIKGTMISEWLIDKKNQMHYNALGLGDEGFCNNQFVGRWNSYTTYFTKKCVWGDYRIPDSQGLDIGATELMISDDYVKNGWESYMKSISGNDQSVDYENAKAEEQRKWWE